MESRAPKLAIAGRIVGFLLLLICVLSWMLIDEKILSKNLRNLIIYIMLGVTLFSFIVSYIASRERKIPELGSSPTVEEQFAVLESTPTSFKSTSTTTDQYGFETISTQTQNIIQSIVGTQNEPDKNMVQSAISSLSQGEIGELSAAQASANPAPHRNATQVLETVVLADRNNETVKRTTIENIPLPDQQKPSIPDLSWMEDEHQFISELSVKEIPLPKQEIEKKSEVEVDKNIDTPNLPDIDELMSQDSNIDLVDLDSIEIPGKNSETPALPDIDSLF